MSLFGSIVDSIIRKLNMDVGNSSGSTQQTVRDSNSVVQVAGDLNVNSPQESKESNDSRPKIGEAYFPESDLTLGVYDFRAELDRGDDRYGATLSTDRVCLFVIALEERDYKAFGIKDNQGRVGMACTVKVPEGDYEGTVQWIEIGQRDSSYMGLRCWFTVP